MPRAARFGTEEGAYELVPLVKRAIINPGDKIEVKLIVTGYGEVCNAKVTCYPSDQVFDLSRSKWRAGLPTGERVTFDGPLLAFPENGITASLDGGPRYGKWGERTVFFDTDAIDEMGLTPPILTELFLDDHAFMELSLLTKRNIRPGQHAVLVTMVYFNGKAWKTSKVQILFQVQNFIQRYAVPLGLLGVAAATTSIARNSYPALQELANRIISLP